MSDGGRENVRRGQYNFGESKKKKKVVVKDEFAHAIARVAVSQILEGIGFQNTHQSALDTLSDVAVRYIQDLGKYANLCAHSAGRSHCKLFDVIESLEDLGSSQGFSGASDVNHCALSSGVLKDIIRFVDETEEIPFARSIPRFPAVKEHKLNATFVQTGENPPEHVPAWLQPFPDPESLNSVEKKEIDDRIVTSEPVEDRRIEKRPMLNLSQHLGASGREDAAEEKRGAECNPFLATPLQYWEKEVSQVLIPARLSDNTFMPQSDQPITRFHDSVLEASVPSVEAVQSRSTHHEDGGKSVLGERRNAVRFRLESGRRAFGKAASLWSDGDEELDSPPINDHEKVNGKRISEVILISSKNISQEQAQL